MPMESAPPMKRRGGCSWSAMVSKGPREFGGVAFLLAVHVLIPLHPLRMTLGVVRDGPRRVARRLLRQQIGAEEPGVDDGGGEPSLCHLHARRATVDGEATEPEGDALSRMSASIIGRYSRRRRGGRLRRQSWRQGCTAIGRIRRSPRPGRGGRSVSRRRPQSGRVRPW